MKVDLEEPDEEIFVDVRGDRAFISRENVRTCGGMPLGSQGKAVAIVTDSNSYCAAWMMMRRGCRLMVVCNKSGARFSRKLREWHIGSEMEVHNLSLKRSRIGIKDLFREAGRRARDNGALAVISGGSLCRHGKISEFAKLDGVAGVPVYRPLMLLGDEIVDMVIG